jgi:hypothetical protein
MKIKLILTLFVWYAFSQAAEPQKTAAVGSPAAVTPTEAASGVLAPAAAPKDAAAPRIADTVKTGFARLMIRSQPDSAAIIIDSVEKGLTPARFDSLPPGLHTMLVKKKGYFVKKITTMLSPDSLHDIAVTLVRPGGVAVRTEPPGATLYLDNKETGTTPYENTKLKPGAYTLRLEKTQYQTVEKSINVIEAACDTLSVTLAPSKAYTDSVDNVLKAVAVKKRKFKRTVDFIVIGAFLVFGAVIFLIEAVNAD